MTAATLTKTTDTTCFLATESVCTQAVDANTLDPEAIAIAASLFDAIVNASELHLCLAVSDGEEDLSKRFATSFIHFTKGLKEGRHTLRTVRVSSMCTATYGAGRRIAGMRATGWEIPGRREADRRLHMAGCPSETWITAPSLSARPVERHRIVSIGLRVL